MTKPGGNVRVVRSVVTDLKIGNTDGGLYVAGVDQDKEGNTLKFHNLLFRQDELPEKVAAAVSEVVAFAQKKVDDA